MKKRIAIFFLVIFSVSFTEAGQLFKFPLLVEHFIDHNQGDKQASFFGFLKSHYLYGHPSDGDEEEDGNLPFKQADYQLAALGFLPAPACEVKTPVVTVQTLYALYLQPYRLKDPLADIFHPPRQL